MDAIGITMGDPSGIGPEIICKALRDLPPEERRSSLVIGDRTVMERASAVTGAGLAFIGVQWWATWYPGSEPGGGGYIAQRMMSAKSERHAVFAGLTAGHDSPRRAEAPPIRPREQPARPQGRGGTVAAPRGAA